MKSREPIFMTDGEVYPISHIQLPARRRSDREHCDTPNPIIVVGALASLLMAVFGLLAML